MNRYFKVIKLFPGTLRLTDMIVFNGTQMNILKLTNNKVNGGYSSAVIFNLTIKDLENKEFFEEAVGVSKDNYILFNKDVVYKIIKNKVEAVLKTKFSDDFTDCYYKKENVPFVKELPKTWESCNKKVGYIASIGGNTHKFTDDIEAIMYATDKQALSSIAYAKLSQLVADINGDWNYSWSKEPCLKYTIIRHRDELHLEDCRKYFKPLCFEKKEDAEFSLLHHKKLWEQMYEL